MELTNCPEFLTLADIALEIDGYTYRPGWQLSTFMHPWEGIHLYVVADVVDSTNHTRRTQLRISSPIPPIPDVEYLGHWLLWRLTIIESHEAREFLLRYGKHVSDPHMPIEPELGRQ